MFVNTKSGLFSYCATIVNFSTFKTLRLLSEKNGEDVSLVHRRSRGEYRISVGQRRTKGETTAAKKANEKEVVAVDGLGELLNYFLQFLGYLLQFPFQYILLLYNLF